MGNPTYPRAAAVADLERRLKAIGPAPQLSFEEEELVRQVLREGVPTLPGLSLAGSVSLARRRVLAALREVQSSDTGTRPARGGARGEA